MAKMEMMFEEDVDSTGGKAALWTQSLVFAQGGTHTWVCGGFRFDKQLLHSLSPLKPCLYVSIISTLEAISYLEKKNTPNPSTQV